MPLLLTTEEMHQISEALHERDMREILSLNAELKLALARAHGHLDQERMLRDSHNIRHLTTDA